MIKPQKHYREVSALNDINFDVYQGDRIGLIGDNGSGKTTLLRIIAGLYKKTRGAVNVKGTMAAFLQLGAGMERDLTTLENIFLFGAIVGLERKVIRRRLGDILGFAEIEDFLHYPLRDLSAGTVQRLVFSIAHYVESDILILDEMLASGDIGFREKCYKALEDNVNMSKTIIIASHQTEVIKRFCKKVLLLDKGRQVAFGPTKEILDIYFRSKEKACGGGP
ncbi:ABC transporter ATP-binding protein [Candidatus Omnitrophota bacterium]